MSAVVHTGGSRHGQCIVPLAAIAALLPTPAQVGTSLIPATEPSTRLAERIGLTFVLRDLCRRRMAVHVTTVDGHATILRTDRCREQSGSDE